MASKKLQRADKQPANNVGTQLSRPADNTDLTCRANVLSQYRDGILNAHGQIVVSSVDLLKRYVVCGSMLLDVSAMIPHGGWKKWLRENFEVSTGLSERTAQRYTKSALGFRKMLVDREYASPDDAIDQTHFKLEYIEEYSLRTREVKALFVRRRWLVSSI